MDATARLRIFRVATLAVAGALGAATLQAGALASVSGVVFLAWMITPGAALSHRQEAPLPLRSAAVGMYLMLFALTAAIGYHDLVAPTGSGVSFAPIFLPLYQWAGFVASASLTLLVERFADRRSAPLRE